MDRDHFSNLSFPQPKKAQYEIWAKLAQQFLEKSFENVKGQMHRQTDGGQTKGDHYSSFWA